MAEKADKHLYWSRAPSNTPPPPKKLSDAQSELAAAAGTASQELMPMYKWGQRAGRIVLTVFVPCLQKEATTVDVEPLTVRLRAERVASFAGNKKQEKVYALNLQLFAEVDAERVEIAFRHDHIRVELPKIHAKPWRTLQAAGIPKSAHPARARAPCATYICGASHLIGLHFRRCHHCRRRTGRRCRRHCPRRIQPPHSALLAEGGSDV